MEKKKDELALNRSTVSSFKVKGGRQNMGSQSGEHDVADPLCPVLPLREQLSQLPSESKPHWSLLSEGWQPRDFPHEALGSILQSGLEVLSPCLPALCTMTGCPFHQEVSLVLQPMNLQDTPLLFLHTPLGVQEKIVHGAVWEWRVYHPHCSLSITSS